MTYKSLDRTIIELSSEYHNLPTNTKARTGRSRKASTTFSTTSGSDATPRKRRYVPPTIDLTKFSDDDDYDDDEDEKKKSGSGTDTVVDS